MTVGNELKLVPVGELLSKKFFIPAYQRGYRWTERQVVELLDDLMEFHEAKNQDGDDPFYCLQPIVVKPRGDAWELVDGQQRLTTIYIILTHLNVLVQALGAARYELAYETRESSESFLDEIDVGREGENIDFFHMSQAKKAIDNWFRVHDAALQLSIVGMLVGSTAVGKKVKVIWYELDERESATDAFTRLNMGKIPLTNAELVKALLLRSSNFASVGSGAVSLLQNQIAQEWDAIERRLQDDAFWFFVSNDRTSSNRIELVLKLAARELDDSGILPGDKLKTFLQFNRKLSEGSADVLQEWLRIKQSFMTLEEWYEDRALFHLIGYLITHGVKVSDIFDISRESETKSHFRKALLERIYKRVFAGRTAAGPQSDALSEVLAELSYDDSRSRNSIKPILLLFNVASLLANPASNGRFRFDKFKEENWDLEHIRSVASERPDQTRKQREWLETLVDYISDEESAVDENERKLLARAEEFLEGDKIHDDAFAAFFEDVFAFYDPDGDEEVDNGIGNLTLLDSGTNRSYKNAVFPVKRARIIELDRSATFVPLCTKNAFLKYYSKRVNNMRVWASDDSEEHQKAMVEVLREFFNGKGVH